jgi:hypothetical protein
MVAVVVSSGVRIVDRGYPAVKVLRVSENAAKYKNYRVFLHKTSTQLYGISMKSQVLGEEPAGMKTTGVKSSIFNH